MTLPRALCIASTAVACAVGCSDGGTDPAPPGVDAPARIEIAPASVALLAGESTRLRASAFSTSGAPLSGVAYVWESSDPAIARVDSEGVVTAVAPGLAKIGASTAGRAGEASVAVQQVPATMRVLACGALIPASIDAAGEIDLYTFTARANDLRLLGAAITSGLVVDATVHDAAGAPITGVRANALSRFVAPATGAYTVRVSTATLTSTSTYHLGLECIDPLGPVDATLAPGSLASAAADSAGEVTMFTFAGNAGDDVLLPLATTGGVVVNATVLAPSRAEVQTLGATGIHRLSLPETGTYVTYVRTATFTHSGSFNFGYERLRPGAVADGVLSFGVSRPDSLRAAGEVDVFTFASGGRASVLVSVANTSGVVVEARIVTPSGAALATLRANSATDVGLPERGTYVVYVSSATGRDLATYNLSIQ